MATWSLRDRPVCSFAPAVPASSVTRRSMAVWMSSSRGHELEAALRQLLSTWSSASRIDATSSASSSPTLPSILAWARELARSCGARRRSKGRLTVKASSSSAGSSAKRPCHRVLKAAPRGCGSPSPRSLRLFLAAAASPIFLRRSPILLRRSLPAAGGRRGRGRLQPGQLPQPVGHLLTLVAVGDHHEEGVVAGDRAQHALEAGPVEAPRPRRGPSPAGCAGGPGCRTG